jgi:hypothetical protein
MSSSSKTAQTRSKIIIIKNLCWMEKNKEESKEMRETLSSHKYLINSFEEWLASFDCAPCIQIEKLFHFDPSSQLKNETG